MAQTTNQFAKRVGLRPVRVDSGGRTIAEDYEYARKLVVATLAVDEAEIEGRNFHPTETVPPIV
jgi:hypothetical protein